MKKTKFINFIRYCFRCNKIYVTKAHSSKVCDSCKISKTKMNEVKKWNTTKQPSS